MDNDTAARVRTGADVRARRDIDVHAVSRIEADSFVPASGAVAFMKGELDAMRKYAPKK